MGKGEAYTGFWVGKPKGRYHLEDPGIDGRIILRWIFRKWDVGAWIGAGSGLVQVMGTCECGNEPWGKIRGIS
jgi:hypothetical protein